MSVNAGARILHPPRYFDPHQLESFRERLPDEIDDGQVEQPAILVLFMDDAVPVIEEAETLRKRECVFRESRWFERAYGLTRHFVETRRGIHDLPDIVRL